MSWSLNRKVVRWLATTWLCILTHAKHSKHCFSPAQTLLYFYIWLVFRLHSGCYSVIIGNLAGRVTTVSTTLGFLWIPPVYVLCLFFKLVIHERPTQGILPQAFFSCFFFFKIVKNALLGQGQSTSRVKHAVQVRIGYMKIVGSWNFLQ
jgi:hypothetical protein